DLASATRYLVNALFGSHGLLVVDADDKTLKEVCLPVMLDDIRHRHSHREVQKTNHRLEADAFTVQVNDRPINVFYLTDEFRERIVYENDRYQVLNRDIAFTKEELEAEIDAYPERFSPNVIMRPLYQEIVLPNLAYVGG